MPSFGWTAFVLAIVYLPMLVEARRSHRNEQVQRARGGIEPTGDVYGAMRAAYPAAFLAMAVEGLVRGVPAAPAIAAGGAIFTAAKALKWWAILALGHAWTFKVVVVPGARLVKEGPYRFLAHPNYAGVMGELAGVMLLTAAWVTGPASVIGFGWLVLRRIGVEREALRSAADGGTC